jgi:hypothetical protein
MLTVFIVPQSHSHGMVRAFPAPPGSSSPTTFHLPNRSPGLGALSCGGLPIDWLALQQNGRDEQIAERESQLRWTPSRFCSIAWCTPVMGVIVWGASPLCEIGSLKEISRPSDHSEIKQHPFCKSGFSEVGHLASMVR